MSGGFEPGSKVLIQNVLIQNLFAVGSGDRHSRVESHQVHMVLEPCGEYGAPFAEVA